jgi:hypothetical protein
MLRKIKMILRTGKSKGANMRKSILFAFLAALLLCFSPASALVSRKASSHSSETKKTVHVKSYTRKDGTVVKAHDRSVAGSKSTKSSGRLLKKPKKRTSGKGNNNISGPANKDSKYMSREIETHRFRVRSDRGTEYIVIEYQEMISFAHLEDLGSEKPGLKRLATSDGSPVNYIDSKTFKIVSTDEIVRKI